MKIQDQVYGAEVHRLIHFSREVLDATDANAEGIMAEITSGAIDYAVLKGGAA